MQSLEYNIKEAEGFDIVGIDIKTTNENDQAVEDINALWQRFFTEAIGDKIPNRTGQSIYAVYTDYEGDHTKPYRFMIGCKVEHADDIPDNMVSHHVPGGRVGLFSSIGEQPASLIKTWQHIWDMETLPRAFTTDYEVYGPKFFEPNLHEVQIFIALENVQ
ncbi:MAG: GyrI-like domain-containing protein [Pseudomonadota bacterium]